MGVVMKKLNVFEYLADGRILAAGKLFRLTAEGLRE
jgi:hypothetical protein